jgi:ferredoxin/flavodoxin---NADP+ reductase
LDRIKEFRAAVIGAGPAGYYVAEHLLSAKSAVVHVDMFERLPTPWGLVRAGVAPDHPKIKSVSAQFAEVARHPRYRFFGNVEFGGDVSRQDLLSRYDAIVYCTGARSECRLAIPGEDLPGSLAASDFVGWYNGHPDMASLAPDLSRGRAVVIGNGNVALDVARMLLLPEDVLRKTDIADHALELFGSSGVRDVTILGRRGPAQAAFTSVELRELVDMEGLEVTVDAASLDLPESLEPADRRRVQRNVTLLQGACSAVRPKRDRRLAFTFLRSPIAIEGNGRVEGIEVGVNRLELKEGRVRAVDTGERQVLPADLVIRAVGYRGAALPEVAFDHRTGVIPNVGGTVTPGDREYVAGWIKRGPSGIIGTNRADADETAQRILADLGSREPCAASAEAIIDWLGQQCPRLVDQASWMRIDRYETTNGAATARPRVKLVAVEAMLDAARGA